MIKAYLLNPILTAAMSLNLCLPHALTLRPPGYDLNGEACKPQCTITHFSREADVLGLCEREDFALII